MAYTTPIGNYPGTDFAGLNHPQMINLYCDVIEELGHKYGGHPSLAGVMAHELDCTECKDDHADQRDAFAAFCRDRFGEAYAGEAMPPRLDAADKWWRRFCLYRIHAMNTFMQATKETADRVGLKTSFCYYAPEQVVAQSWAWGYDPVALEQLCHRMWVVGYRDWSRVYHHVRGVWLDFGIAYRGVNLSRNLSTMFHGKPSSFFQFRMPNYIDANRHYYNQHKTFFATHGDFYTGYYGLSDREVALFLGRENTTNWIRLAADWQGGASPAKIAVAVSSTPFVMQHPEAPGIPFGSQVTGLIDALSRHVDIDGLLLGSRFTCDPERLLRYRLIILPRDMGVGLSPEVAEALRQYVARGGRLLVVASPLIQTRPDLTRPRDLTEELCGLQIEGQQTGGYFAPVAVGGKLDLPEARLWTATVPRLTLKDTEVLVRDAKRDLPLLLRHGDSVVFYTGHGPRVGRVPRRRGEIDCSQPCESRRKQANPIAEHGCEGRRSVRVPFRTGPGNAED